MEFVRHNKKLISTISIATTVLVLVFNLLYYIFAPIQSQGDPKNFVATPILEKTAQSTPSALPSEPQQSPVSLISLSILLVIVLLIIVIIFALLKYASSQRHNRDKKRRDDLKRLAQAFEAYRQEHGQYPLSSTYLPQYYTGVNLSNDWNYYGLPDKEHMVRYLPDWPISDPSIDYNAKHQVNQYIYYPKENGQKFFLYAHLEAPTKAEQIDYNQQDNLLRSWGAYNYRVTSGQEQPSTVQQIPHPQHAKPAAPQAETLPPSASPSTGAAAAPASTVTPPQQPTQPAAAPPPMPVQPLPAAQSTPPVSPPASSSPVDTIAGAVPAAPLNNQQPELANPMPPTPTPANQAQPTTATQTPQQPVAAPTIPAQVAPEPDPLIPYTSEPQFTTSPEPVIAAMPPADQPTATNSEPSAIDPNPDSNQSA